jgi:molybdenum transport protein
MEAAMLSCLSDDDIARLIKEDVPYLDLTTFGLGIGRQRGTLEFYTRHPVVACGTEEAAGVLEKLGADVSFLRESGTPLEADQLLLKAAGSAEALHAGWRIALNLMEYSSGMATRTAGLVKAAKEVNADASVVATRKVFPGTRTIMAKAIVAGGALPHRLGLSETILVFKQHTEFIGGFSGLLERIAGFKKRFQGHKITVEVESAADGWKLAETGAVDIIQMDKIPLQELAAFVPAFKARHPAILLAAAGGINQENVRDYAATGVDLLVTSWLYFGKPADIAAKMIPTAG